ncbi:ABC transporter permease [Mesorhizobium sp. BHbsci]
MIFLLTARSPFQSAGSGGPHHHECLSGTLLDASILAWHASGLIFSTALGWLPGYGAYSPTLGNVTPFDWLVDRLRYLVLPASTLALGFIGQYVVVARAAMSDVVTEDYMVTARAKGLTAGQMLTRHAFRNAMLPVVTVVTLNIAYVVAGGITVEAVFAWPGIGSLTVEALNARDYPVLQGIFLLLGASIVVAESRCRHLLRHTRPEGTTMNIAVVESRRRVRMRAIQAF